MAKGTGIMSTWLKFKNANDWTEDKILGLRPEYFFQIHYIVPLSLFVEKIENFIVSAFHHIVDF